MAKVTRRELPPNDPFFSSGPLVFTPITKSGASGMPSIDLEMMGETLDEHYAEPQLTLPQRVLLDRLKSVGPIQRGTVEESLYAALNVAGPPV